MDWKVVASIWKTAIYIKQRQSTKLALENKRKHIVRPFFRISGYFWKAWNCLERKWKPGEALLPWRAFLTQPVARTKPSFYPTHLCLIWCDIFEGSVAKLLTKEVKVRSFFCSRCLHLGKQSRSKANKLMQGWKNAIMSSVFPISADLSCHEVWLYIGPIMTGWFRRLVWCN